jgi:hypothetical protein
MHQIHHNQDGFRAWGFMILSLNTRCSAGLPALLPQWIADEIRGGKECASRIVARDSFLAGILLYQDGPAIVPSTDKRLGSRREAA